MRTSAVGNFVPHKKPRHCPEGHVRCSKCNRLVRAPEASCGCPALCDRCQEAMRPSEAVVGVMTLPPVYYGRNLRPKPEQGGEKEQSDGPKRKRIRTTAKRVRKFRAVIRNEDGRRFENVKEAAKVTSGGKMGPSSLYLHLSGKQKTFCGCTFRYEEAK